MCPQSSVQPPSLQSRTSPERSQVAPEEAPGRGAPPRPVLYMLSKAKLSQTVSALLGTYTCHRYEVFGKSHSDSL